MQPEDLVVDLPPWAQTVLTAAGILSLVLPAIGRSRFVASRWPTLSVALVDLGNDLDSAWRALRGRR